MRDETQERKKLSFFIHTECCRQDEDVLSVESCAFVAQERCHLSLALLLLFRLLHTHTQEKIEKASRS